MKKVLIALLVLLAAVVLFSMSASANEYAPDFGDTNFDGSVNATDALDILRYTVGKIDLDPNYFCFSDTDSDYDVDATDALNVLRYTVGKIDCFEADCGFDGIVYIPERYDDLYMQLGCTSVVPCWSYSNESEDGLVCSSYNNYLDFNWTAEWAVDDYGDPFAVLFLTGEYDPDYYTYETFVVYYDSAPGIYRILDVEVGPTDPDLILAYNFVAQWTPDFGDINYTAPYYMDYITGDESEMVTLRYDGALLMENTNGADDLYTNYLNNLEEYYDFEYVGCQDGEHSMDNEYVYTNADESVWIYAELYEDEYGDQIVELQFVNVL